MSGTNRIPSHSNLSDLEIRKQRQSKRTTIPDPDGPAVPTTPDLLQASVDRILTFGVDIARFSAARRREVHRIWRNKEWLLSDSLTFDAFAVDVLHIAKSTASRCIALTRMEKSIEADFGPIDFKFTDTNLTSLIRSVQPGKQHDVLVHVIKTSPDMTPDPIPTIAKALGVFTPRQGKNAGYTVAQSDSLSIVPLHKRDVDLAFDCALAKVGEDALAKFLHALASQ